jgi:hypothetical protein
MLFLLVDAAMTVEPSWLALVLVIIRVLAAVVLESRLPWTSQL